MTGQDIITKFELFVGDMTELSSQEELDLLNKIYNRVCSNRPWEFLKTNATGTILTDSVGSYITVPSDFASFAENNQYTENNMAVENNASPKVIFVGTNYRPIQIINFSDRRQYRNQDGYAYLDFTNSKIYFTYPPTETTYDFDYIKTPTALTLVSSPIFPTRFQDILYHGMAVEDQIIQLSDKARSYAPENQGKYDSYIRDMSYWNAQLILN